MSSRLQQIEGHVGPPSISHGPTNPALLSLTLGRQLRQLAAEYSNQPAVISQWQQRRLTYAELNIHSDLLAKALANIGVQQGVRVAVCAGNCYEYVVILYAVAKLQAILVAVNPSYTERELHDVLQAVDVGVLFMSRTLSGRSLDRHFARLRKNMHRMRVITLMKPTEGSFEDSLTFTDLQKLGENSSIDLEAVETDPMDTVNIQFTSGTTGTPKAACLTHHNILNNAMFIGRRMALSHFDKLCIPVPLFHCFGMVLGTLAAFSAAACAIYPSETFEPAATLSAVERYKCTALHGVPTMFLRLLEVQKQNSYCTTSLRTGIAAGTVVTKALMARIIEELKLTELTITYGMTETSPASTMSSVTDSLQHRIETVGRVMPHTIVKIVDEAERIVPIGRAGQVYTAGYLLHKGYWKDPVSTEATIARDQSGAAFMKTGDVGIMDHDGYLRISGRVKDLIIRGGENINPSEIENLLVSHPEVGDSSVIGVQDDTYGEVVGAFIECRGQHNEVTLSSIQDFCRKNELAYYKIPMHVFTMGSEGLPTTFPKTMSGKIQKYLLRDYGERVVAARKARKT